MSVEIHPDAGNQYIPEACQGELKKAPNHVNNYQVGDLIFTGSDTVKTSSIELLDKIIITFQRIQSLLFHGKFYSKASRNTHVAIVVEVDKATGAVWIAEACPTKKHKNDLRQVDLIKHNYYQLHEGSKETYEVLRCNSNNPDLQAYVLRAAEKAAAASTRVFVKNKNAPSAPAQAKPSSESTSSKPKHKFSYIKGLWSLLTKEKKGQPLSGQEYDLTKERKFFCSYFVSLMLRNGEFASKTESNTLASPVVFDFDAASASPQKLREYLEGNKLFEQIGTVLAPDIASK